MKFLNKFLWISFASLLHIQPLYANDVFSLESDIENEVLKIYSVDLTTKEKTFLTEKNMGGENPSSAGRNSYVNPNTGEIVVITSESGQEAYNWKTGTWRTIDENLFPDAPHILQIPSISGNGSTKVLSAGDNSLKLKEAYVYGGPVMKRFRAASMGRASSLRRPTSHLTVVIKSEKKRI